MSDLKDCLAAYASWEKTTKDVGLSSASLRECYEGFRMPTGLLHINAYKPTGYALGAPLPECPTFKKHQVQLILTEFKTKLENLVILQVPEECWHITILNKTNYRVNNHLVYSTNEEDAKVKQVVDNLKIKGIGIQVAGLLITTHGAICLKGVPESKELFCLRDKMAKVLEWKLPVPITAHIKIAHLSTPKYDVSAFPLIKQLWDKWQGEDFGLINFDSIYSGSGAVIHL